VASLADRLSANEQMVLPRGMPDCADGFSERRDTKNDVVHDVELPAELARDHQRLGHVGLIP
jgi:hypothetical protein